MNTKAVVLLSFVFSGCVVKGYAGKLPEGVEPARISFSAGSQVQLEAMRVGTFHVSAASRGMDLLPGKHVATNEYQSERWLCEGERAACKVVQFGGVCRTEFEAAPDGSYTIRVELRGEEKAVASVTDDDTDIAIATAPCESRRRSVRYRDGTVVPFF